MCTTSADILETSLTPHPISASRSPAEGSQVKFLAIYAAINLGSVTTMFMRQVLLYLSSIRASKTLFTSLLKTIMRAPMSFFDTTPIGRVLNRFSKDM